jgi:hypothetical protein
MLVIKKKMRKNDLGSPQQRKKGFDLHGNVFESHFQSYNSKLDPHLANFFLMRQQRKPEKLSKKQPIYKIYNSNKCLTPIKYAEKPKTRKSEKKEVEKLPEIGKKVVVSKSIKPISAEQLRRVIKRYRNGSISRQKSEGHVMAKGFSTG